MIKIQLCLLLTFLVTFRVNHANAQLEACVNDVCPSSETDASTCNTDDPSLCVCDITFEEVTNDCALSTCDDTSTTTIVNGCGGANTACTSATTKCQCAINYEVVGGACNLIACTADNEVSKCTDTGDNDYCDTTAGTCACKKNFVGTNAATCTAATCSDTVVCSESNSVCTDPTSSGGTCVCDHLSPADTTSGACVRHTCTVANVATVCGTEAACELNPNALQCVCKVNFAPSHVSSATACIQKTCTGTSTTNCDPNSACASDICQCASTHTASGSRCKRDCSSGATVCDSNAACVSDLCECNVNYEGGGGSSDCTQLPCTGDDATTCHPNSQCVNSKCQCADDYEPSGTTCVECPTGWKSDGTVCKKTCTSDTGCGPTTAVCTSDRCECATNHVGNGTSCTAKTCTANSDCNSASNYTCTSGSCACASGYSFSNTERDCIMNAGGIVLYSLSLMVAALLLSIFANKT